VALTLDVGARVEVAAHRPAALPGVSVLRFRSQGHLFRTVPDRFATVLHLAGRSEWTVRGARWSGRPGTLGLKVPGELHADQARQGEARFQVVAFDDDLVEDARAALGRGAGVPTECALDGDDPRARPLVGLHRQLMADDATPAELEHQLCAALTALVALVGAPRREPAPSSAAVARARALLDARLGEAVSLDELAAHARLDKYRLCRAFRTEVGLPPHAYVTHRRIAVAKELLARGMAQADVAVRVGLYDQSQLHRHFKRILGITPGAYARAFR
jgi:AraC-like DNA-binding protein